MAALRHLTYREIDPDQWDKCIDGSINKLIYAESVYLNHMSPHWEAFVYGDYEAVMPICWKKKWGIRYVMQPPFIQQLGIFSPGPLDIGLQMEFIRALSETFRFTETTLNYANGLPENTAGLHGSLRNNYLVSLTPEASSAGYFNNAYIRQRYNRSQKKNLSYRQSTDISGAVRLYQKLYQQRLHHFTDDTYQSFEKLCHQYAGTGRVIIREVGFHGNADPLALVLLLKDSNRLYNMASCLLPEGKKALANYYLYGELIREFSGSGLLLDLEGSDVPGIAFFYEKMADVNQPYPFIKINRLPIPLRWFK